MELDQELAVLESRSGDSQAVGVRVEMHVVKEWAFVSSPPFDSSTKHLPISLKAL